MSDDAPHPVEEVVKRLQPKGEVLRELFLKSGNLCAFPGCSHLIMDPDGAFVGEMCHIEAAETEGERFNPAQTNEQRRELQNLVLLCHRHHVITDDVVAFPVAKMRQLKNDHENRVNEFASQLQFRVADLTKRLTEKPTVLPRSIAAVLNWGLSDDELAVNAEHFNKLLAVLKVAPVQARELLVVAVERSGDADMRGRRFFSPEEVDIACGLPVEKTLPLWGILDRLKIAWDIGENETGRVRYILMSPHCEWDAWGDFLEYDRRKPGSLHQLVVGLDFTVLD